MARSDFCTISTAAVQTLEPNGLSSCYAFFHGSIPRFLSVVHCKATPPGYRKKGGAAFLFSSLKIELYPQVSLQLPAIQLVGLPVQLGELKLFLLLIQPVTVNFPLRNRNICNHMFDFAFQNMHFLYSVTRPLRP